MLACNAHQNYLTQSYKSYYLFLQRNSFKDAHVCLFVFDCLHYNGETLLDKFVFEHFSIIVSVLIDYTFRVILEGFSFISFILCVCL